MIDGEEDEGMYYLGRTYGGDVPQKPRQPWMNRTSGGRDNNNRPWSLNPEWVKGAKDSFFVRRLPQRKHQTENRGSHRSRRQIEIQTQSDLLTGEHLYNVDHMLCSGETLEVTEFEVK